MSHNPYIYILIMAAVTFAIRVLPLTLVKKQFTNTFVRSFLYYVPYVTLSVMTFPAIINATHSPIAGIAAFAAGLVAGMVQSQVFSRFHAYVVRLCSFLNFLCDIFDA
mgnify:CR=1 FL=1